MTETQALLIKCGLRVRLLITKKKARFALDKTPAQREQKVKAKGWQLAGEEDIKRVSSTASLTLHEHRKAPSPSLFTGSPMRYTYNTPALL